MCVESSPEKDLIRVEVRLYSTLRRYAPGGQEPGFLELPAGSTVAAAIKALGIPEETPKVVLVNGRHASPSDSLREADSLVFFPPVEGG